MNLVEIQLLHDVIRLYHLKLMKKPAMNPAEMPIDGTRVKSVEKNEFSPPVVVEESPRSSTDRLQNVSNRLTTTSEQLETTNTIIANERIALEQQREKLGLPPDTEAPPGRTDDENRAARLTAETDQLTEELGSLRHLESAIGKIKLMDSPQVTEIIKRVFPPPEKNPEADQFLVIDRPEMTLFGVSHGKNPESKTIRKLYEILDANLQSAPDNLTLMVEGMHNGINREQAINLVDGLPDRDAAVRKYGENGVAFWAVAEAALSGKTIEISSPEAPDRRIIDGLSKPTDPEDIALYLTIRQFTSDIGNANPNVPSAERLKKFVQTFNHIQETTGVRWMKEIPEAAEIVKMMEDEVEFNEWLTKKAGEFLTGMNARLVEQELVNKPIVPDVSALINVDHARISMQDINELHDPKNEAGRNSVLNRISREWNGARDRFLVERIADAIDDGKKPFVIFGGSHVASIEKAAEELVTE
jgi:hypothetical protein